MLDNQLKTGKTFKYKGKEYEVIETENITCDGCSFEHQKIGDCTDLSIDGYIPECISNFRSDRKNVIFKEVSDENSNI